MARQRLSHKDRRSSRDLQATSLPKKGWLPRENRSLILVLVILAIIAYLTAFFACPLPSVSQAIGISFRRYDLFQLLAVPEVLITSWLGQHAEFALLDRVPVVAVALAIMASATAWGVIALQLLKMRCDYAELFVFGAAAGSAILSGFVLLLGCLGGFEYPIVGWAVMVPPWLLLLLRFCMQKKTDKFILDISSINAVRGSSTNSTRLLQRLVPSHAALAMLVILGSIVLLGGALPPVDFDVREYHLQAPKEFFAQRAITFLPHNVYGNMPLGVEMHALLAMLLLDDFWWGGLAGKTLIAAFGLIGAASCALAVRQLRSPGEHQALPLWAAVFFLITPWVIHVSSAGLNDVVLATYVLLAFVATRNALERLRIPQKIRRGGPQNNALDDKATGRHLRSLAETSNVPPRGESPGRITPSRSESGLPWIALAGFLAGATAGCKYTGAVYAAVPLAFWIAVRAFCDLPWKKACGVVAIFCATGFLGGGGWYIKNAVFTGNPVYPLAYQMFDGTTWNAEKAQRWNTVHRPPGFRPADLARDVARIGISSEWQSAAVIPFAILGMIVAWSKKLRFIRQTFGYLAFIFFVWWAFTHRIDRFWLPALPFLCIFASFGIGWSSSWIWRAFALLILGLAFLWAFLAVTSGAAADNKYFAPLSQLREDPGRIGADHVLLNRLFREMEKQRGNLPKKLLAVGDAAVFELEMPVLYATCFDDQHWEKITRGKRPGEVLQALRAERVAYVYVNWAEIARYRSPGNYGFTDFVQPAHFRALVQAGVLIPVLMPPGSPNQIFLVP